MTIEELWAAARARAEQLLGSVVEGTQISNLEQYLQQVHRSELQLARVRDLLKQLDLQGHATATDFHLYNNLRRNLTRSQQSALTEVRRALADQPEALRTLPRRILMAPVLKPNFSRALPPTPAALPEPVATGTPGVSGLGNPAAVTASGAAAAGAATAGAAMAPWMIAGLILTALVTIGVLAGIALVTVALNVENLTQAYIIGKQAEMAEAYYRAHLAEIRLCYENGGTPETCAHAGPATPREALVPIPQTGQWVPWVVGGAAGLVLVLGGTYLWFAHGPGRKIFQRERPSLEGVRNRRVSAERFPYEPAEDAGLEV